MKHLLIVIIMTLSTSSFAAATKTEIIEEEVCHAVAGCWINPSTGECPDCVIETRKIVTEIKDEPIVKVTSKSSVIIVEKKKILNGCTVLVANRPRPCDWKMGAHKMIAAKKRARKECGGFDNWVWTNDTHTKYECKG